LKPVTLCCKNKETKHPVESTQPNAKAVPDLRDTLENQEEIDFITF
jgi:hypothetical protein